jgi:anti-anti-sigma factor
VTGTNPLTGHWGDSPQQSAVTSRAIDAVLELEPQGDRTFREGWTVPKANARAVRTANVQATTAQTRSWGTSSTGLQVWSLYIEPLTWRSRPMPGNDTGVEAHLRSARVLPNAGQGARSASGVDPSGSGYPESVADIGTTAPDQPDDCQVAFELTPDGVVVSIGGELDAANAGNVRDRLVAAIQDYPPNVRLDLAGLRFIDSSAVGLLVAMKQSVNDYGGHFSMRCSPAGHLALGRRGLLDYLDVDSA